MNDSFGAVSGENKELSLDYPVLASNMTLELPLLEGRVWSDTYTFNQFLKKASAVQEKQYEENAAEHTLPEMAIRHRGYFMERTYYRMDEVGEFAQTILHDKVEYERRFSAELIEHAMTVRDTLPDSSERSVSGKPEEHLRLQMDARWQHESSYFKVAGAFAPGFVLTDLEFHRTIEAVEDILWVLGLEKESAAETGVKGDWNGYVASSLTLDTERFHTVREPELAIDGLATIHARWLMWIEYLFDALDREDEQVVLRGNQHRMCYLLAAVDMIFSDYRLGLQWIVNSDAFLKEFAADSNSKVAYTAMMLNDGFPVAYREDSVETPNNTFKVFIPYEDEGNSYPPVNIEFVQGYEQELSD